ncbi:MAG: DMT family transporter [Halanaerobiales bacterium]|nr:DMT family transporter [Halanaerobiales bacterium]
MNKTKGIILTIFAAMSFGFQAFFAKVAYANGFNPFSFTLYRSLFAAVALFILIKVYNIDIKATKAQYITLLKLSFFGYSIMLITLYISFLYMSTGLAMTLHFIYPVVVMVASVFIYKEKIIAKKVLALILSIIGIYFLIGFGSFSNISMIGFWLALISGILYAYYILTVANSNIKQMNSFVITFYLSLFNTYIVFFLTLISGNLSFEYNYIGLLSTVMVALVCNIFGMVSIQIGLKYITATAASILSTFEPITSLIVGIVILNEFLAWYHFVGSLFILISVVLVTLSEKKIQRVSEKTRI